jgi:hypothetical protein
VAASASASLRRAPATLWREGEFGVVLLAPGQTEPRTLTGTGRALWRALERPITPAELAAELADAFGVSSSRVEADITPVLAELRRIGAIEPEPA